MNAWMLPLSVFDGWETPTPVSDLHLILLCVVGPLLVGLLIAAIGWAPRMMGHSRDNARAEGLLDDVRGDENHRQEVDGSTQVLIDNADNQAVTQGHEAAGAVTHGPATHDLGAHADTAHVRTEGIRAADVQTGGSHRAH